MSDDRTPTLAELREIERWAVERVEEARDSLTRLRDAQRGSVYYAEVRLAERERQLRNRRAEIARLLSGG
jgi:hypothetical protein